MKTKHNNLNLPWCAILVLGCGLATWGCSPRKPVTRIDKNTTPQVDIPTLETVPPTQDSIDPATVNSATVAAPETIAKVAVDPLQSPAASIGPDLPDEPPQTWSTHRILALASTGPIVIDVSANIGGKSLDEAAAAATGRAEAQIAKDLDKPWTWAKLLDHPLISSGWLGNLVPEGEQRGPLIGMYDKDGDEEADDDELPAFLTRGLARQTASSSDPPSVSLSISLCLSILLALFLSDSLCALTCLCLRTISFSLFLCVTLSLSLYLQLSHSLFLNLNQSSTLSCYSPISYCLYSTPTTAL